MKNGIYSHKDMVEKFHKEFGWSCKVTRSYFKYYGWKWNIIFTRLERSHVIKVGALI